MGLDMYLTGKIYLSGYDKEEKAIKERLKDEFGTQYEPCYVEFEIIRWRKANAIHRWFVENVQGGKDDCAIYYVSEEELKELLELVKMALKSKKPQLVLPTQEGFFFGSTEYNEMYREDLEQTVQGIENFLASTAKRPEKDMDIHYQSSW